MNIRIELTDGLAEDEVIIRCARVNGAVQRIHRFVLEQDPAAPQLVFHKENQEFFFPVGDVLFFETEGEQVFAHTTKDAFRIRYRLYELEDILPRCFVRISKSTIVNSRRIYCITRNLAAASLVQFAGTHKQVYASRRYYAALKQRLYEERGQAHEPDEV